MIKNMNKKEISDLKRIFKHVHAQGLRVFPGDQSVIFRDIDMAHIQIYEIEIPLGDFEFQDQDDIYTQDPGSHNYVKTDDIIQYLEGKIDMIPLTDDLRDHTRMINPDTVLELLDKDIDNIPYASLVGPRELKEFRNVIKGLKLMDDNLGYCRFNKSEHLDNIYLSVEIDDSFTGYDSVMTTERKLAWYLFDADNKEINVRLGVDRVLDLAEILTSCDQVTLYFDSGNPFYVEARKSGLRFRSCLAPANQS